MMERVSTLAEAYSVRPAHLFALKLEGFILGQPEDISTIPGDFVLILEREGIKVFSSMGIYVKCLPADKGFCDLGSERLDLAVINNFVYKNALFSGVEGYKIV